MTGCNPNGKCYGIQILHPVKQLYKEYFKAYSIQFDKFEQSLGSKPWFVTTFLQIYLYYKAHAISEETKVRLTSSTSRTNQTLVVGIFAKKW